MESVRQVLADSPALLLFAVIGLGYVAGQLRVLGFSLGVAGVLFVGLAVGGWQPEGAAPLTVHHDVTRIGLVLFVYAVGLSSGPGFFDAWRQRGLRYSLAVLAALLASAAVAFALGRALGLLPAQVSGVFCGGLTNTPALAAVTELIRDYGGGADPNDAAVAYSVAYPFGVVGGLVAFDLFHRALRAAAEREAADARRRESAHRDLVQGTFTVANPAVAGRAIGELRVREATGLLVSRHQRGEHVEVPTKYTVLQEGDLVLAVGRADDMARAADYFGPPTRADLRADRDITMRRVLVSRRELVGRTLASLDLDRRFNATVTRVRRADVDMLAGPEIALEMGDRLRVVMPTSQAAAVAAFFGDSERSLAELDYTALTLGICLGVLLGMVPLPVPGGRALTLGFAGGPLVAGLVLGRLGRTGPLVWSIPLESNHALRHMGLLFFLAGVGVTSGSRFFPALADHGAALLAAGAATTAVGTFLTLALLRRFAGASVVSSVGATSGMQTQPATLARAYELSRSDETYVAYATTYPVAMVAKILLAQALFLAAAALSGG